MQVRETAAIETDENFQEEIFVTAVTPGDWIIGFFYDGLGRLIAIDRPDTGGQGGTGVSPVVTTHIYYDGVRRIQEVGPCIAGDTGCDDDPPAGEPAFRVEREYVYGPDYVDEHLARIVPAGWASKQTRAA